MSKFRVILPIPVELQFDVDATTEADVKLAVNELLRALHHGTIQFDAKPSRYYPETMGMTVHTTGNPGLRKMDPSTIIQKKS